MRTLPAFKKRTVVAHSDSKMFQVVSIENVGTFIFATCGTVGLCTRIIQLLEAEIAALNAGGAEALYSLAEEIDEGRHEEREFKDERQEIYGRLPPTEKA